LILHTGLLTINNVGVLAWLSTCYINANSNLSHTMRNLSAMRYPILLLALLCASCGTALPSVKPYKLDVQQGNVVTSKMLLQLRPGMTQSQVRFIMGTPLIQDSFHGKRWDYVYQMRENGKITEQRRVILDFEKDVLKTVRGDVIPSTTDASKSNEVADNSGTRVINPSAKAEDKSLFGALKFWKKEPVANPAPEVKAKADEPTKQPVTPAVTSEAKPVESKPLEPAATPVVGNPESQSVLAVPLLPVEPSPVASAVAPVAAEAPAAAVVETPAAVAPSVESASVEAAPVVADTVASPVATPMAEPAAVVEPAAVQSAAESSPVEASSIETGVEASSAEPLAVPAATPTYESPSGMQFERNLSKLPEDIAPPPAPEPAPVVSKPPAASTELPKAKELPVTAKPSFFDRMLEKIGF
jgi:outer membrane protein assembly factor BamE